MFILYVLFFKLFQINNLFSVFFQFFFSIIFFFFLIFSMSWIFVNLTTVEK